MRRSLLLLPLLASLGACPEKKKTDSTSQPVGQPTQPADPEPSSSPAAPARPLR